MYSSTAMMAWWMEVVIFVVSSVIGLLINAIHHMDRYCDHQPSVQQTTLCGIRYTMGSKLVATAVVMVWSPGSRVALDAPAPRC